MGTKNTSSENPSHYTEESNKELHVHIHNNPENEYNSSEIDLKLLLNKLWERKYNILKTTLLFGVLGILIAFLSRVEYESSASLILESQSSQSTAMSLLQQYGGVLGISGAGSTGGEDLSPQLYPKIAESIPYQLELMHRPITFATLDTTISVHRYFNDIYEPSGIDYLKKYTIGLPGKILNLPETILNWFTPSTSGIVSNDISREFSVDSIYVPNSAELSTMSYLTSRVKILREESGIIKVTVEMPDPRAAAEVGREAIRLLKEYIQRYKTQKSKSDLAFIQQQTSRIRKQFEEAQQELAEFRDSNINLSTATARTREQELESEYQRYSSIYNSLSQQLERAKIRVQENTPVFSFLEPIKQPISNSKPNYEFLIIISLLLGMLISFGLTFSRVYADLFITNK